MGNGRIETGIASLVQRNRFTIAVVFPVVGGGLLVASAEGILPAVIAYHPFLILFGTAVMRLPLVGGLLPIISRRELAGITGLALYAWGIEFIGVASGWPYGSFSYGISLGPMVGGVPVALPLFFIPLVLNAYVFTLLVLPDAVERSLSRGLIAVGFILGIDLVLDPAAVSIGFWSFLPPGPYYGVPWTNFWGWCMSGLVAIAIIEYTFDVRAVECQIKECEFLLDDLVSFTILWGMINLLYGNLIPVGITCCYLGGLGLKGQLALGIEDRITVLRSTRL